MKSRYNMSRIIIYLLLCLSFQVSFAASENFALAPQNRFGGREEEIQAQDTTKEIQSLLNRVEILEHTVSKLESKIGALENLSHDGASKTVTEAPSHDIFDLPAGSKNNASALIAGEGAAAPLSHKNSADRPDKSAYDLALAELKDNRLDSAEEKFAAFLTNYPGSNLQSNAYFWYGESFFRRKIFDKAAINYLKGYKDFPKGAKAADSLLKLALSLGELGRKKEACSTLEKLDVEFPDRPVSSIKRAKDARAKFGCK